MFFSSPKQYSIRFRQFVVKRSQQAFKLPLHLLGRGELRVGILMIGLGLLMASCTAKSDDRANASPPGALGDDMRVAVNKPHGEQVKPSSIAPLNSGTGSNSGVDSARDSSQNSEPSSANSATDAAKDHVGNTVKPSGSSSVVDSEPKQKVAGGPSIGNAQARPNPKLLQEVQAKKSKSESSGPKTPHVPGEKEPAALQKRAKDTFGEQCRIERSCGPKLLGIDCQAAVDGPYYYVDRNTFAVVAHCGGNCMGGGCTNCPPKGWTCAVY